MAMEGKKIRPLPSSYISSISGSAKYSIKLCKYAADFASMLRFGRSSSVLAKFYAVLGGNGKG